MLDNPEEPEEPEDLYVVDVYEDCSRTEAYFDRHSQGLRWIRSGVPWKWIPNECHDALKRIQTYLEVCVWHESTHPDTYAKLVSEFEMLTTADPIHDDLATDAMWKLGLGSRLLSCAKAHMLHDMLAGEVLRVAGSTDRPKVEGVLRTCEDEETAADILFRSLIAEHKKKSKMTKSDIMAQKIASEFSEKKSLNKFEQKIHNDIGTSVAQKIEEHWQKHQSVLSHLKCDIRYQKRVVESWNDKVHALELLLEQMNKRQEKPMEDTPCRLDTERSSKKSSMVQKFALNQDDKNSAKLTSITASVKKADDVDLTVWPERASAAIVPRPIVRFPPMEATQEAIAPIALESSAHNVGSKPTLELPSAETTQNAIPVHSEPSAQDPAQCPMQSTIPVNHPSTTAELSQNSPRLLTPSHATTTNTPSNTNRPSEPQAMTQENKENLPRNSPTSPMTPEEKQVLDKAFVGIDQYAKGIFAKSPASSGIQQWMR